MRCTALASTAMSSSSLPNCGTTIKNGRTKALKESLSKLKLDYVDLYLIHWPVPAIGHYVEAWQALIELQQQGLTKSIGVCNFQVPHLQKLIDEPASPR